MPAQLLIELRPELSTHSDDSDATFTLDQSSTLSTPPTPASEDSTAIGGGFLADVPFFSDTEYPIEYVIIKCRARTVNPVSGDAGIISNARVQWIQDGLSNQSVPGCNCTVGFSTVSEPSAGDFDFVNIGQTVTISGTTETLPGNAVVLANAAGVITLSIPFGGVEDAGTATLTFARTVEAFLTSFTSSFAWVSSSNLTESPDNVAWTWSKLRVIRDVSPMCTFSQDIEPATSVLEVDCSEVVVEVWGTPPAPSFTLVPHAGAWV